MMRVLVRSRSGNVTLAIVGALYTVCALSLLAWFIADSWHASPGIVDRLFIAGLLVSAACGVWFLLMALANLGTPLVRMRAAHTPAGTSKAASIHR